MTEQLTFDGFDIIESDLEKIERITQKARDQYGYHKIHISGYYEMEKKENLKPEDMKEVLEVNSNKDKSVSVKIDSTLFVKIDFKKSCIHLLESTYNALRDSILPKSHSIDTSTIKNGVKLTFESATDIIDCYEQILHYTVNSYIPANRFGCCSKYNKCSKSNKCLHENLFYAKGCYWRERIENFCN